MKKILLLPLFFISLFFIVSCVNPAYLTVMSVDEIVEYMNKNFDGTFVYNSTSTANSVSDKDRCVAMKCTLPDSRVIDVTTTHRHTPDYFGVYHDWNGIIETDYYSWIYGTEADKILTERLTKHCAELIPQTDFVVLRTDSLEGRDSDARNHYKSAEEYASSRTNVSFYLILLCDKPAENDSLILSLYSIEYDTTIQESPYEWAAVSYYYFAPDYKDKKNQLTTELIKSEEWYTTHKKWSSVDYYSY